MLEICGNLAHLYIYQNVREQNETIFLILGRKIVPLNLEAAKQLISWLLHFFQICAFGTTPLLLSSFANRSPSFPASLKTTQLAFLREVWRHVTMVQWSQQSSWQRRPLGLSNDETNVWATVLFLSAIMQRKDIHFSCYNCRSTVCWDPETFLP